MKKLLLISSIILIQACTSFPAAVLPVVPDLEPMKVSESKPLYLSGVKSRLTNVSVGQMKIGNACMNEKELRWGNNTAVNDIFRDAIINEISKYGYSIPTDTLELKNQDSAEILIGARLLGASANICSAPNGVKGDAVFDVEWTIYAKQDKTSIKINTKGKGSIPELVRGGGTKLWSETISDAARNLLANDQFNSLVMH